jgi:hypothetical protein
MALAKLPGVGGLCLTFWQTPLKMPVNAPSPETLQSGDTVEAVDHDKGWDTSLLATRQEPSVRYDE